MWRSVVVLLFIALVNVAESHSKIHPLSVHKTITENLNVKRQTPEQNGCVEAKVNQTLPGSECEARVNDIEIALNDAVEEVEDDQDFLNLAFQVFCKPECGNLFLETYEECGVLDDVPGFGELFIGICSNNQGTPCYSYFYSAINASTDTAFCYLNYQQTQTCQCEDKLKSAVESQGCCLTVYQNFFQTSAASKGLEYNPNEVYGYCNVRDPGSCSNSTLTWSPSNNVTNPGDGNNSSASNNVTDPGDPDGTTPRPSPQPSELVPAVVYSFYAVAAAAFLTYSAN